MTKKELIANVAKTTGVTQKDAQAVVDEFVKEIANELFAGNDVNLSGFGSFKVKERAARSGRNPKTKETVEIPASKSVAFKPASTLKEGLNK